MVIRQGDLSFVRQPRARFSHVKPADSAQVLALGEESGHWHEVIGATVARVDGVYTVTVPGPQPAIVRVQPASHASRHAPVELPPGTYVVPGTPSDVSIHVGQREYAPGAIARPAGD